MPTKVGTDKFYLNTRFTITIPIAATATAAQTVMADPPIELAPVVSSVTLSAGISSAAFACVPSAIAEARTRPNLPLLKENTLFMMLPFKRI